MSDQLISGLNPLFIYLHDTVLGLENYLLENKHHFPNFNNNHLLRIPI